MSSATLQAACDLAVSLLLHVKEYTGPIALLPKTDKICA